MPLPPPVPTEPSSAPRTSGLAIAALVCGILSILGGAMFILPLLLAIIFGHIALSQCNRDPQISGKGMAIAGLALGYASILFVGLMAAMAIPAFQKVRETSLQKAMINDARQLGSAAQQELIMNPGKPVSFAIDASGKVSGPLAQYVAQITPGTEAVDSTFRSESDGFSLRHPHAFGGKEVLFNEEGRMIDTP